MLLTGSVVHDGAVVVDQAKIVVRCRGRLEEIGLGSGFYITRHVRHPLVTVVPRLFVIEAQRMSDLMRNYADLKEGALEKTWLALAS